MRDIFLVKKLVITEKAARMESASKYIFMVKPSTNKSEVKKAIKELYHVDVLDVNIIRQRGKTKRFRNTKEQRSVYKKAIATLKAGQKIELK